MREGVIDKLAECEKRVIYLHFSKTPKKGRGKIEEVVFEHVKRAVVKGAQWGCLWETE